MMVSLIAAGKRCVIAALVIMMVAVASISRTISGFAIPRASQCFGRSCSSSSSNTRQFSLIPLRAQGQDYNDVPYREGEYDPIAAEEFYRGRPWQSGARLFRLLSRWLSWTLGTVVWDRWLGRNEEDLDDQRVDALVELLTDLGPTFIKVGQALSTRSDLLPARYSAGLARLQDAVPPFDAAEGRAILERELGLRHGLDEVFSSFDPEPVASASIGQVYRAVCRENNRTVAVKVQRPRVLGVVSLDLYLLRSLAPWWQRVSRRESRTDLVALVDAWGAGFVRELDYAREARATAAFADAMRARGLDAVCAPEVVPGLSRGARVLTTRWVDGERLSDSTAGDVPRLCGLALNAYLTMLLDTGTLHCDPHPGNLLRTTDGRLCILDWGMVQTVPTDLQYSLLEFIAHLNAKDYESVPEDLVNLGFVPSDKLLELRQSGLTVAIASMLDLAALGGGPKGAMQNMVQQNKDKYKEALKDFDDLDSPEATKLRQKLFKEDWKESMAQDAAKRKTTTTGSATMDVTKTMEELQQQNADVFAIPDYFLYMSRAFATLEGIGLSSSPDYAILQECYPYLAKRLLSDDSPRARRALSTLLYGASTTTEGDDASAAGGGLLNLDKLQELSKGFESYTTSTTNNNDNDNDNNNRHNAVTTSTLEPLVDVLLNEDRNFLQDALLKEVAMTFDAALRDTFLKTLPPIPAYSSLPLSPNFLLQPLHLAQTTLALNDRDEKRLKAMNTLLSKLGSGNSSSTTTTTNTAAINNVLSNANNNLDNLISLAQEASRRRNALTRISLRLGESMATVQATRLRDQSSSSSSLVRAAATTPPPLERIEQGQQQLLAERLEGIARFMGQLDSSMGNSA